jgi:hypothetical protein
MCSTREMDFTADAVLPFEQWQQATQALKAAEARGASHTEIVRLSAEAVRAGGATWHNERRSRSSRHRWLPGNGDSSVCGRWQELRH